MIKHLKLSYTQVIALSFLAVILTGTLLLCLPISSRDGVWTPFVDSMFTATTSTCVTGLIVFDTYTHWSLFGQIVIMLLIQVGGLGLMTIMSLFAIVLKKNIGLHERRLLMQSAGSTQIGGMVRLIKRILALTAIFEGFGLIVLATRFVPRLGWAEGLYYSLFHSVSAFCNAGIDIMGQFGQSSFVPNVNDPVVSLTLMFLIVTGGLGFLVWNDLIQCRFRFKKLDLHSKLAVTTTVCLIVFGGLLFYMFEYNYAFAGMNQGTRWLASFFQSVTPRTAGFNTVDQAALSESGSLLTMVLMFIGGSPGSTAGGIKTTTFAVLLIASFSCARNEGSVTVFKRKIDNDTIKQASAIATIYMSAVLIATSAICAIERVTIRQSMFEVISAIGTVGLTMGITPTLCSLSKYILIALMYTGRIGGLSLMVVLAERRVRVPIDKPVEKILIG